MTEETLKRANEITKHIEWADTVLCHIKDKDELSLYFNTSDEFCIERHRIRHCPEWLKDIIKESISNKREKWARELEEM